MRPGKRIDILFKMVTDIQRRLRQLECSHEHTNTGYWLGESITERCEDCGKDLRTLTEEEYLDIKIGETQEELSRLLKVKKYGRPKQHVRL